jgi:hypothetical protein
MPATRTHAQQFYVPYAYSSSSSESSVLDRHTPFFYIRIPKILLLDYGRLLSDKEIFNEIMATIGHWQSLVNHSKTIWHLWLTSRRLLEELDRQRHEAWVVFTRMERMGLQQELYGSRFTASLVQGRSEQSTPSLLFQPSFSPLSSQPSQFHSCEETVINDNLSDYHESEDPLASLSSLPPPPLGTMTKMISTVCSVAQVIMRRNQHSPPLRYSFFIVKTVLIGTTFTLTALNTSVTTAPCMPCIIANLTAQTVKAGDFNHNGG